MSDEKDGIYYVSTTYMCGRTSKTGPFVRACHRAADHAFVHEKNRIVLCDMHADEFKKINRRAYSEGMKDKQ